MNESIAFVAFSSPLLFAYSGNCIQISLQIYNESANQDGNRIKNYIMRVLDQRSSTLDYVMGKIVRLW